MANVKAKILAGNAEYHDTTHAPKKGEQHRRLVAKKGSVVEMSKEDFDSLLSIKAVVKASSDEPVGTAPELEPGATFADNGSEPNPKKR